MGRVTGRAGILPAGVRGANRIVRRNLGSHALFCSAACSA